MDEKTLTDLKHSLDAMLTAPTPEAEERLVRQLRTALEASERDELERRVQARTADLARANEELHASVEEKVMLLQEIHHRVKNNLQIISSLLELQAAAVEDTRALEAFLDSGHRVRSMALVHEKLYGPESLSRIDFADYVRDLTTFLFQSYNARTPNVGLTIEADDVFLDIHTAVPCGLILNELITNSLKHAFPGSREGKIRVGLHQTDDGQMTLSVGDDGVGFPQDLDWRNLTSLGFQLIKALVNQLTGTLTIDSRCGAEFEICFPVKKKTGRSDTQNSDS